MGPKVEAAVEFATRTGKTAAIGALADIARITRGEAGTLVTAQAETVELLALDEALDELAQIDPRKSKVVELRYFGGLSLDETAEVLQVSLMTVRRDWRAAKAWLYQRVMSSE